MIQIYLDWNIITNLIKPEQISNQVLQDEFLLLKGIFEHPDSKLIIPYSNAHLKDLMKSYKKGERERVLDSLSYVSELTKNVCLAQYWNEKNAKWHLRDPIEFFNSMLQDNLDSLKSWEDVIHPLKKCGIDKIFDIYKFQPHGMDFKEIEKYSPFFASLFPKARAKNTMYAVIQDIFDMLSKINSNPTVYKELRKIFKDGLKIDSNISNLDNTIEQLDTYLPKTMLNKSFTELCEINKNDNSKNKDYGKVIGIYMQLDFVGYNSDKLSDKNKYDNIFTDALHCFYAAHCDFYLTNDNRNYKKSKAVYESEKIGTQVYKTKEFIDSLDQ